MGIIASRRPDALKGTLKDTLLAARPTMFFGVPRVWEKLQAAVVAKSRSQPPGWKKSVAGWAKGIGLRTYHARESSFPASRGGRGVGLLLGLQEAVANKLVFGQVRAALGLDQCSVCLTGAAPISRSTLEFFGSLGLPVLELYGMSECTGPQTMSLPEAYRIGSCGRALPGCELKIEHVEERDKEGEGEICYRGRHIMLGYLGDEKNSIGALDDAGFLHSGDVGRVDEGGFLHITGRIKELLITAGGENIAPRPIEEVCMRCKTYLQNEDVYCTPT